MNYTIYHYLFFFFLYSFLGWVLEEIFAAFKYGKMVNRGFVNGPLCIRHGIIMVILLFNLKELVDYPLYQGLMTYVVVSVTEYFAGVIIKLVTGKRPWDYSKEKFNLNGYVSLTSSIVWTAAALFFVWVINPFAYMLIKLVPVRMTKIVEIVLIVVFMIDIFVTIAAGLRWKIKGNVYETVANILKDTKSNLLKRIFAYIERRMYNAFPELREQEKNENVGFGRTKGRTFAKGLCFDKLVLIFFISALLGDWIETVYVWAVSGVLISRSSLIYGTFSIVWGLGGMLASAILYPLRNKNDRYIFLGGFFMGGVYEYMCSVFTELVFGTVFWDYSHLPFNINGRINLLFCFFWGIAGIVWLKVIYPVASRFIEKIPPVAGKISVILIIIFMAADMLISSVAISRYVTRKENGTGNTNAITEYLDTQYSDKLIERIYPNMKITE